MESVRYIVLLLALTIGAGYAQHPVCIRLGQPLPVVSYIDTFSDSTRQLTLTQIQRLYERGQFQTLPGNRLLKNYTSASHWLHLQLAPAQSPQVVYLEIDNPRINQVEFYQVVNKKTINQVLTGDSLPFGSRVFPHFNWIFPILPDAHRPTDLFIKLDKHNEILSTRLTVWDSNTFERQDRQRYLLWGMLAGLTVLVLLINGMVWLATTDALYGWFMAVIVVSAFNLMASSGLGFQYVWPNAPVINAWYPQTISTWLIVLAHTHFMQRFIGQQEGNSRIIHWVNRFKYSIIASVAFMVGLLLVGVVPSFYFRVLVWQTLFFSLMVLPLVVL
ncbi:MAG: hypothetical protein EOO39_17090, partial [Cytophagaceae bacterium]